jgi:hypothetical protein
VGYAEASRNYQQVILYQLPSTPKQGRRLMEDNESRTKPPVAMQSVYCEKNCAACQYFDIAGGWEMCKLFETQTKGVICPSFVAKDV